MQDVPRSPQAGRLSPPSWLDARLVLGVLLVLVSVVVGARVLSAAERTQQVWTAVRDLPAGTALSRDDLRPTEVRLLGAAGQYLPAPDEAFVGYVLERGLGAGELVPVEALQAPGRGLDVRYVSVPVLPGRFPADLAKGELVDVWATPDRSAAADPAGAPAEGSRLVLEAVPVQAPPDDGGALGAATAEQAVVLAVATAEVGELLTAMSDGRIDLVRVPGARDRDALPRLQARSGGG